MRNVSYDLTFKVLDNNLAPAKEEWGLTACVYLTGHFNRNPIDIKLPDNTPVNVTVTGELPFEARGKIPLNAAICIAGEAFHYNQSGIPALVGIGTTHIMLQEIERKTLNFKKDVHLTMHTTNDKYEKAIIQVTLNQKKIGNALSFSDNLFISANVAGNSMQERLELTYKMEMAMGNTIPGTGNVRAFLNLSESGFQLTGSPVPALGYVQGELPKSNLNFWKNALDNVLEREGYTTKDIKTMSKNERARIAFLLIDYPITILPYVGDEVDRRSRKRPNDGSKVGYEEFGVILAMLDGDCEDGALGIVTVNRSFDTFMKEQKNQPISEPFTLIHETLQQYVPLMTLCVVHGAKADDDSSMPKGAHMADMGFPVHYFKKSLESTKEGKLISSKLPWPKNIDEEYQFQIGEATGMLDPYGYHDPKAHVRAYLHQGKYFSLLKHPMVMEHGKDSPFFLGGLQGWTPYFSDHGASEGIGGFWLTDNTKGTRGALYTDFTNERKNVGLRPMPEHPEDVQYLMKEANMFRIPPKPLVITKEIDSAKLKNKFLDNLQNNVKSLKRKQEKDCIINIYLAPHQINAKLADGLFQDVKNDLTKIWNITYKTEQVTDNYHGYRLKVHVNVDN
jgi:hypothetical protein